MPRHPSPLPSESLLEVAALLRTYICACDSALDPNKLFGEGLSASVIEIAERMVVQIEADVDFLEGQLARRGVSVREILANPPEGSL